MNAYQAQKQVLEESKASLLKQLEVINKASEEKSETIINLNKSLASAETTLLNMQQKLADQKQEVMDLQEKFASEFKNLANEIFEDKSKRFTDQNKSNLDEILTPLKEKIMAFEKKIESTNKEQLTWNIALKEQLTGLREMNQHMTREAENLTKALKGESKVQGGWGEYILENILEKSGLVKEREFFVQQSFTSDDGRRQQPDVIIALPEGKNLVIDAKVSLSAYERYCNTEDKDAATMELRKHMLSVKSHIKSLHEKNYQPPYALSGLDFVLMFGPIESALIAALQQDPSLTEYALKRRVALLSPANFLATVRTVASVWMVHKQNANARDIASRAGLLYDKFVGFADNLKQVGTRLDQARKAYDGAVSQLSSGAGNLVGQAEKLRALGAKHNKQLDVGMVEDSSAHRLSVVEEDREDAALETPPGEKTGEEDA